MIPTKVLAGLVCFLSVSFISSTAIFAEDAASPAVSPAKVAPKEFTGEDAVIKTRFEKLFASSQKVNQPKSDSNPARIELSSALDWDRIAKDCLGKDEAGKLRWNTLSPDKRTRFQSKLKQVILATAYSRMDSFWKDTKYEIADVVANPNKDGKLLVAKFVVNSETFTLQYSVHKVDTAWKIYDIQFEDMKYSENISEQLEAFLETNNFETLLKKLEQKRKDVESGADKGDKKNKNVN